MVLLKIGTVPTYGCILVRVIVPGNLVVKRLLSLDWLIHDMPIQDWIDWAHKKMIYRKKISCPTKKSVHNC